MAETLWMKLRMVPWDQYDSNPGTAKKVPKILENLASRKAPRAMKASHELWAALCAGQIAPAAEPAVPFLVEILGICQDGVQSEILDILLKFAKVDTSEQAPAWHHRLIKAINHERFILENRSHSRDEVIAQKAQTILNTLPPPSP